MTYVRHALLLALGLVLPVLVLSGCDSVGTDDDSDDGDDQPAAPTSLTATPTDGAVELDWAAGDDADAYNVYRSPSETDGATGDPLATDVSNAQYTDNAASNGQVYYYRVTALAGDAESEASDEVTAQMPAAEPGTGGGEAWTRVKVSADNTIHDVAYTSAGAYAVAGGGILLKREADAWTKVLDGGPRNNGSDLFGLAVTDDGTHLWLVGASGAVGEYDVTSGSLTDRSAPMDVTNNFTDVAVTGQSGSARVTVTGASGQVYYSASNGESGTWTSVTPGSGAGVRAVDFYAGTEGHIVDGNQTVYATTDGETWSKTGISDADVGFEGVDSDASDDVWVVGGSGTVFHWNGSAWSTTTAGEPTLMDVVVAEDDQSGFAVGNSGAVFAYDGSAWGRQETPTGQNLKAVVQGDPAIAVGAGGTILER